MKKPLFVSILFIGLVFSYNKAIASNIPDGFERIRCTCYLPTGNKTADGTIPYEGIIASNREHMGDVAILYTEDGEYIGLFEVRDTGGAESLKNGTSVDVFRDNMDRAKEWIATYGDYVLVKWVKAEG